MSLEAILDRLPEKWFLSFERGNPTEKKKKKEGPWSVYVSNGETFGTKKFVSVTADGWTLEEAVETAKVRVERLEEEIKKEKK